MNMASFITDLKAAKIHILHLIVEASVVLLFFPILSVYLTQDLIVGIFIEKGKKQVYLTDCIYFYLKK